MNKEIHVGVIHSLSGTMGLSEAPLVDAALMAFDEINQSGGILNAEIVPVVEDCKSDAEAYARKTDRLICSQGIRHFFGCWTSASRKAVKPVVEKNDALLWYPVQYEGLEQSPNIIYTGNCLNQQIEPAVKWASENLGKKCYLVGSDYVFPKTANRLIHNLAKRYGIEVLGESYLPLGAENFQRIVDEILQLRPDVVFNTINGDSFLAFYYYLKRAGNTADKIPVLAFSIGEVELRDIGSGIIGHYACSGYFQCLDTEENQLFIERFRGRYGDHRVVSDPVVSAYIQPYLWRQLVEKTNSFEVSELIESVTGICHTGPSGSVEIHANHHAVRPALIGKVNADLQFDIIWQHPNWIEPLPWLGLEKLDLTAKDMIMEALAAFPEALDYPDQLQQEVVKRKQAELDCKKDRLALKNLRFQYQSLLKAFPAGVVLVDADTGLICDCNPSFEEMIGKSRPMLNKQCIWELCPPDQWNRARRAFLDFKSAGKGDNGPVTFCTTNGREVVCRYDSALIRMHGKSMLQLIFHEIQNSSDG